MNPKRGMYVSLQATKIGNFTLPSLASNILGNAPKEDSLVHFIMTNEIQSVSLYNLAYAIQTGSVLVSFIRKLVSCGVSEINGVVGSMDELLKVMEFSQKNLDAHTKFDGIVTELEFWDTQIEKNTSSFLAEIELLEEINRNGYKIIPYIGWLTGVPNVTTIEVASLLAKNSDRIFVHCYVKDPMYGKGYIKDRVDELTSIIPDLEIWPIFSAEGTGFSAGSDVFMGDWLKSHSMIQAEQQMQGYPGYQWYEYGFLRANG